MLSGYTTLIPFSLVMGFSALKDIYEDLVRSATNFSFFNVSF